jgi:tRNA (guanine26-N2/guanine27-N2)-dimethyltransferase
MRAKAKLEFVRHAEGRTKLLVPQKSLTKDPPPTTPVFFNPAAKLNRDITVAVTDATRGRTFCDSMAGVGARGLRVASEVGRIEKVSMVDFNPEALRLARKAAALNGVRRKCEFSHAETTSYLYSRYGKDQKFDYVDVDPFGTPARQLQAALSATKDGGIVSITATDTAVLCGVYPKVCIRRYGASPINNHFHHETAIRILIGALARQGGPIDNGIESVVAHSTRHYLRVFARVRVGAAKSDTALGQIGYVEQCRACGHLSQSHDVERSCERCRGKVALAGPLWLGPLVERMVASDAQRTADKLKLNDAYTVLRSLADVDGYPPWSYSIDEICSDLKVPTVPESEVLGKLESSGFKTFRQPFEIKGLKTDANYDDLKSAILRVAKGKRKQGIGK